MADKRAQGMIEYVVLLVAVVAALIGMQVYLRNSLNGRLRDSAKQLSGEVLYAPGNTSSLVVVATNSHETSSSLDGITESSADQTKSTFRNESLNDL